MKLLEYASKEIFKKYGIPVAPFKVARTVDEVKEVVNELRFPIVIKAQVPVGGRGKAGGIKLAQNENEAIENAKRILGMEIKGVPVKKVLVSEAVDIKEEYYMGIVLDRRERKSVVMVSKEGGVDIEEVAREKPESIHKLQIDPFMGLKSYKARELAFRLFADKELAKRFSSIIMKLYEAYVATEAQLAEINPLALDQEGNLWAVDAKIIVDDNALFRHKEIEAMRDLDYEDKKELEAKSGDLSYVKLDGEIGCCVNGAGLAMATMDLIKKRGGEPANFLDIGGSSSPEKVRKAVEIILSDKNVKTIFFNIFGGITRCDDVANGLIEVFKGMKIELPIVIRLTGTNEEIARKILEESGYSFHTVRTMREGADKSVELAKRA